MSTFVDASSLIRSDGADDDLRFRPHVLGWGEDLPPIKDNAQCHLCGEIGQHDVITLGMVDTFNIVADVRTKENPE